MLNEVSCTIPLTVELGLQSSNDETARTINRGHDFGAFVDIGVHQDGLVHISQVANRRLRHPSEAVKVGDVVNVVVLEVDQKRNRISLSMKQAKQNT